MAYASRRTMWMEVDGGYRGWFLCPNSGADSSPEAWGADGTLLNGGGYALNSWGSHKVFQYSWPDSSSRQDAQFIKSLADGTYGRGLIHFIEPTLYDQNILPARVADPSMAVDDEGASLVYGYDPEGVPTSGWETNMLPLTSAYYNLFGAAAGYRGASDSVYVPIPDGYTLYVGAFYSETGSGGIFARPVNLNGSEGTDVKLTLQANNASQIVTDGFSGVRGIRLWLGKTASGAATVTATALIARLIRTDRITTPEQGGIDPDSLGYGLDAYGQTGYGGYESYSPAGFTAQYLRLIKGPWIGGMGHSGCRFVGKPTFSSNTGVNGGQVGFAATFREIGSWVAA